MQAAGGQIHFMIEPITEDHLIARLQETGAQVLLVRGIKPVSACALQAAPALRLVAKNGAGVDGIDLDAARARGVAVAVAPGANARAVAEHAVAMMLSLTRQLPLLDRMVRAGQWALPAPGRARFSRCHGGHHWLRRDWQRHGPTGRRAGRPRAGAAPARPGRWLCDPRAAPVSAPGKHPEPALPSDRAHPGPHRRAGPALLPQGSILINTARGPVVNEAALINALQTGHLEGAGLDTFDTEPIPASHPLTQLPNALLTPHVAGVTARARCACPPVTAQTSWTTLRHRRRCTRAPRRLNLTYCIPHTMPALNPFKTALIERRPQIGLWLSMADPLRLAGLRRHHGLRLAAD